MLRRSVRRLFTLRPLPTGPIGVGDSCKTSRTFTADDVAAFGKLVGDNNPIHFNDEAAKAAGFKGRIVHGMLVSSIFSEMMGMNLPGKHTIYMSQTLKFTAPVYIGDEINFAVTIKTVDPSKGDIVMETLALRATDGRPVVKGEAKGRNTVIKFRES